MKKYLSSILLIFIRFFCVIFNTVSHFLRSVCYRLIIYLLLRLFNLLKMKISSVRTRLWGALLVIGILICCMAIYTMSMLSEIKKLSIASSNAQQISLSIRNCSGITGNIKLCYQGDAESCSRLEQYSNDLIRVKTNLSNVSDLLISDNNNISVHLNTGIETIVELLGELKISAEELRIEQNMLFDSWKRIERSVKVPSGLSVEFDSLFSDLRHTAYDYKRSYETRVLYDLKDKSDYIRSYLLKNQNSGKASATYINVLSGFITANIKVINNNIKLEMATKDLENRLLDLSKTTDVFTSESNQSFEQKFFNIQIIFVVSVVIFLGLVIAFFYFVFTGILVNLSLLKKQVDVMKTGAFPEELPESGMKEFSEIGNALNEIVESLSEKTNFTTAVKNHDLDVSYSPLSADDLLGKSLLEMRASLKNAKHEELLRKEVDKKQAWATEGLARFGDILRQNQDNLQRLSDEIICNLVKYLKANQGGIFTFKDDSNDQTLSLVASFAYDRKKFIEKEIQVGEGLVGTCAIEKETILLTDIPDNYVRITSGLGEANPRCLIIVPLLVDKEIMGVIEIASFKNLEPFEIEFIEKIGESIASTLSNAKATEKTTELLERTRQQAEMMATQEEEMRQNLEEMLATQEEAARREVELSGTLAAINKSIALLEYDFDGIVISYNNLCEKTYGYPVSKIMGKKHTILFTDGSSEFDTISDFWSDMRAQKHIEKIVSRKNSSGETITLKIVAFPFFDHHGEPFKVMEFSSDITELKMKEDQLQHQTNLLQEQEEEMKLNMEEMMSSQEEHFKMEAEHEGLKEAINITCAIAEYDLTGSLISANENMLALMDCSLEMVLGRSHAEFSKPEETSSKEYSEFWKNLQEGSHQEGEFFHVFPGREGWFYETYVPIKDESFATSKIIVFATDISAERPV